MLAMTIPSRNHRIAGPRILQRLVVLRLRDHLVEEDGALAPEESALSALPALSGINVLEVPAISYHGRPMEGLNSASMWL